MQNIQDLFLKYKQDTDPTSIQREASNPIYSVWLTASAGTGKTKVLIDRILRLLLSGNDVSSILAITFTNAAAFEMKDRIMKILQGWILKTDTEIKNDLINLYGNDFRNKSNDEQKKEILKAKNLFAKILDSPYGLRIETIHAFCQFILKKFPIEAGINPNFSILSNIGDINLILTKIYKDIIINKDKSFLEILDILLQYKDEKSLFDVINSILSIRRKFNKIFSKYNINLDNFDKKLQPVFFDQYNIDKKIILTDNPFHILSEYINHEKKEIINYFSDLYVLASEICNKSVNPDYENIVGKTPIKQAKKVLSFLKKYEEKSDFDINDYINLWTKNFLTNGLVTDITNAKDILGVLQNKTKIILKNITQLKHLEFNYAITKFAYIIIKHYDLEKQKQSLLDYDDLIEKTLQLLTKSQDYSGWVLYKLDQGISHILLDEAQDTTPEQWEIIDTLTDGFFYSGSSKNSIKTIFVVGDYKQSIYSFQGANIDNFEFYHNKFEKKITEHKFLFKNLNLETSFRTSFPVLSFINEILSDKDISSGIISKNDDTNNYIHKISEKNFNKPGFVELWPIIAEEFQKDNYDYWNPNQVIFESTLSKSKLANIIAKKIKSLITKDKIDPSDIMILLNRRTDASILSYLIKKLIDEKIDIAGIDKLVLTDNIIICDLLALARACISDYDDLNIAGLLKSPFFRFNEMEIFDLCYNRENKTIIEILSEKNPSVYMEFKRIQKYALSGVTAFDFFTFVLNSNNNWKKCYERAGMETEEVIQEFLSICLSFEQSSDHYLGLSGFISWISRDSVEIQRSVEKNPNKIRIMTIHSAKGLQAKVVFLPDTMGNLNVSTNDMKILFNDDNELLPYIRPPNVELTDKYNQIQDKYVNKQIEEKKRLLYVAITRAEEAVYICGYGNKRISEDKLFNMNNFYGIALKTFYKLSNIYDIEKIEDNIFDGVKCIGNNNILRISKYENEKLLSSLLNCQNDNLNNKICDTNIIPFNYSKDNILSKIDKNIFTKDSFKEDNSVLYGILFHKLLEIVPINYSEKEEEKLKLILNQYMKTIYFLSDKQKKSIINKLINGLKIPEIRYIILNHNSLSEVVISSKNSVLYRIDKLIIDKEKKEILIVDYKTDSNSKQYLDKYKHQLKLYKTAVQNIYSKYKVSTAIFWLSDFSILMLDL